MIDLAIGIETGTITLVTDQAALFAGTTRLEFSSSGGLIRCMTEADDEEAMMDGLCASSIDCLERSQATEATMILVGERAAKDVSTVPFIRVD